MVVTTYELAMSPHLGAACAMTAWCAAQFFPSLAVVYGPTSAPAKWGGMVATTAALVACALDIVVLDAQGPPGLHWGQDGHCLAVYRSTADIADCTNQPAEECWGDDDDDDHDPCEVLLTAWLALPGNEKYNLDSIWRKHGPRGDGVHTSHWSVAGRPELRALLDEALTNRNGTLSWSENDQGGCIYTYDYQRAVGKHSGSQKVLTGGEFILDLSHDTGLPKIITAYPVDPEE